MMGNPIPKSVSSGIIDIFGVNLEFHILDDGSRVIEAESMAKFFEAMENPNSPDLTTEDALKMAKFIRGVK